MNQKCIYMQYGDESVSLFESLEEKGLTHIFYDPWKKFVEEYSDFETRIKNCLTLLQTTDIKLVAAVPPFGDPASTTWINSQKQSITDLFTNTNVDELSFDDYIYPNSLYVKANDTTEAQALIDFANTMADEVHDYSAKISAAFYPYDYNAAYRANLMPIFDYSLIEIYGYHGGYMESVIGTTTYNRAHDWVNLKIKEAKKAANTNPIVPIFITYQNKSTNTPAIPMSEIVKDINSAITLNTEGYCLFNYRYGPSDVYFPDKITREIVDRTIVNRQIKTV